MAAMKKTAVSTCLLPSESILFFLSANHRQEALLSLWFESENLNDLCLFFFPLTESLGSIKL